MLSATGSKRGHGTQLNSGEILETSAQFFGENDLAWLGKPQRTLRHSGTEPFRRGRMNQHRGSGVIAGAAGKKFQNRRLNTFSCDESLRGAFETGCHSRRQVGSNAALA